MNEQNPDLEYVDIRYVANLARIALKDDEVDRLQQELDEVLAYIQQLNELDLEGIEPMSHPQPQENVLRDDVVVPGPDPETLLRNAPSKIQGLIRVPQMMEES
jgi:aspartyl-tRNA(Asn)/glutamyl-tRNA(Gln) amidotransferase subunit C